MSEVFDCVNCPVEQPVEVTPAERLERSNGATAEFIRGVLAAQQQPIETPRPEVDALTQVPHARVLSSVGAVAAAARFRR